MVGRWGRFAQGLPGEAMETTSPQVTEISMGE